MADRIALVVARDSRVLEGAPGTPFTRALVWRAGGADVVAPGPRGIRLLGATSRKPTRPLDARPRLDDVLFSIRRYLRTTGGSP